MKLSTILIIVLSLTILFSACNGSQELDEISVKEEVVNVKSMKVETTSVPLYGTYFGEVKFSQSTTVVAEINGDATHIAASLGKRVKKGEVLLSYPRKDDNIAIENKQIEQSKISLAELKLNLQRQQKLLVKGAVNKVSVEALETQIKVLENTIDQLEIGVGKIHKVKAPFDGIIAEVHIEKGQQLAMGMPLFTIAMINNKEVEFFVLPKDFLAINIGSKVEIKDGQNTIDGVISEKAMALDPICKAIKVVAQIQESDPQVLSGSMVELRWLKKELVNVLAIPEKTVTKQGDSYYVFVAKEGRAIKQKIQIDQRVGLQIVVRNGLQQGDEVITAGINKLKNNTAIEIVH